MENVPGPAENGQTTSTLNRTEQTKQTVVAAAIRCFRRNTEQRTSIAEIAIEADISRRSFYRLFEDRHSLLEHVVVQTLEEMGQKVRAHILAFETVEDAIIEGALYQVDVTLSDNVFREIMYTSTNYRIERLLFSHDRIILKNLVPLWGEIIERGKREGDIKASLSTERVVELAASCNASLLMREDLDEAERRRFLRDLLWAAIKT